MSRSYTILPCSSGRTHLWRAGHCIRCHRPAHAVRIPKVRAGHEDAGQLGRNHYDWFMPDNPTGHVDDILDDLEAKLTESLTDPFVHDMAHSVLPLIAAYRECRAYRARAKSL